MKGQMKLGIIRHMRFPAWLLLVPTTAFCAAVEQLPAPTFADTEVTTNIPFAVSFDAMSRVNFTLSLDASPTNGAEEAIGTDADGDGNLSLDEADFTVGYRCGKGYRRDAGARSRCLAPAVRGRWNSAGCVPATWEKAFRLILASAL